MGQNNMVKKKVKQDLFWVMADAIIAYMKEQGWNIVVIGEQRIVRRPPLKYNFTLSIDFTGKQIKKD